jgi:drug/metabolite transporter (DMT)-like permease
MILILALYAMFASVFTIAKFGLDYTTPLFLVGSRMAFAGVVMLLYVALTDRKQFKFNRQQLWKVSLLAIFNIYLTNVCEFWGLQHLSSFKTCFIYSLSPFLTALFAFFMFSEKMTNKKWLGMAIGFIGFIPILATEGAGESNSWHFSIFSLPELSVIAAAVFSVYGWTLLRQLIKEDGFSFIMANGLSMTIGGVLALVHSYATEVWDPIPLRGNFLGFLECAVLLCIVSNFICYNLYGYLLKKYTSTIISFAGWSTPVFAAFFGWITRGEEVTLPFYLSASIVLLGLFIFYQAELSQGYYAVEEKPATAQA